MKFRPTIQTLLKVCRPSVFRPTVFRPTIFRPSVFSPSVFRPSVHGIFVLPSFVVASFVLPSYNRVISVRTIGSRTRFRTESCLRALCSRTENKIRKNLTNLRSKTYFQQVCFCVDSTFAISRTEITPL